MENGKNEGIGVENECFVFFCKLLSKHGVTTNLNNHIVPKCQVLNEAMVNWYEIGSFDCF